MIIYLLTKKENLNPKDQFCKIDIRDSEVFQIFELDKRIKPVFLPSRQRDIIRSRVDFSKAEKGLACWPKYDFKKGLKKTISFFKNINEK